MSRRIDLLRRAQENLKRTIVIGGVGNLGSRIAHNLAKQSFGRLILIDNDKVGYENIGYQEYESGDIGLPKVKALKNHLESAYPWVKVEAYDMYIAGLGGFLLDDNELREQDHLLRKIFSECNCIIVSFDRVGPRLTMLTYSLIYNKPIILVSAWSSILLFKENAVPIVSHHGRINLWKAGLPCPLCYTYFQFSSEGGTYVAHPLISDIVSSLSSFFVEAILWDLRIYPYATIELNDEDVRPRIEYFVGNPSKKCPLCSRRDELRSVIENKGLAGLLEVMEEAINE
ncbi:MAG: ThiF family adenylyltransferase [candidate division WOR-3 bacterium]